jgi:hypothetical protein
VDSDGREKTVAVNFDLIESIFQLGARIDWPDEEGQTILHEVSTMILYSVRFAKGKCSLHYLMDQKFYEQQ